MADVNLASMTGGLEQFIRKQVVKQYNRSSVTANLIRKEVGMGKNLAWDVSVGTGTGQVFDDGEVVTTFNADTEVLATLPWAEYGDAFKITGRAEDGAQYSRTELASTWMYKLMQTRERAAKLINDDIWVGPGTAAPQRLYGLTMATNGPLTATGTYAGISRATYPQFGGIQLGNGGVPRAITEGLIQYGFEQVFNASGKIPTFGITTSNVWRMIADLVSDKRVVMQDAYVRGQKLIASLGFAAVEVNGVPVFKDPSVPSGWLGFFSEDSIALEYLPTAPARIARGKIMSTIPLAGLPQEQDMTGVPGGAGVPLMANIIDLPSQGNFESWMLDCTLQLKVTRPNAHFVIKDIAFRAE